MTARGPVTTPGEETCEPRLRRVPADGGAAINVRRALRGVVLAGLASVLVYAALALATDLPAVLSALRSFPVLVLLEMLALSVACYAVRALRWGLLMRAVGYPVGVRDAFYLHWSGMTMSVSPGRVGEVLKPWLASRVGGMPMATGVPLVFVERVADLIAVVLLSLGGLSLLPSAGPWALVAGLAALAAGTAIAGSRRFHDLALRVVEKQEWARRHLESAGAITETLRTGLGWRTLSWSTAMSFLAWGFEGVGFWLCLLALNFDALGAAAAVSVYAVSTIIGAFTFLPGGIGLTEASMAGLLVAAGMPEAGASAATLIVRVATLWWGVSVGWLMLLSRPSTARRAFVDEQEDR